MHSLPNWALLVATQHAQAAAAQMSSLARLREVRQLLDRASEIATPERTVALIAQRFSNEWRGSASDLPPRNLIVCRENHPPLSEVGGALAAIRAREANSCVVLIPADHCAAVEPAWVTGVQQAFMLATANRNTVYLLHDKPVADGLAFEAATDLCSSTVAIGTADALIDLCYGNRLGRVVEVSTGEHSSAASNPNSKVCALDEQPLPIDIFRIRSIEEYARLQRGDYARQPAALVDVRA